MFKPHTRNSAEKFFEPYKERLCKCVVNGFGRYQEKHGADAHCYEIRTKAGTIRDLIVDSAKTEFGFDKEVEFLWQNHMTLMKFGDEYLLRFKKFNEDLSTSNFSTPQAQAYTQQIEISGIPSAPLRLEIGYMPDEFISEIKGIYIVCPNGDVPSWSIRLDQSDIESGIVTNIFDTIDVPLIQVKLKDGIRRKEGTNDVNG